MAALQHQNSLRLTGVFPPIITSWLCLCPQLNIYTPLPQSSPAQFVPEKPGVIQSGLTAARERVLPVVQAVKVYILYIILCVSTEDLWIADDSQTPSLSFRTSEYQHPESRECMSQKWSMHSSEFRDHQKLQLQSVVFPSLISVPLRCGYRALRFAVTVLQTQVQEAYRK